MAIPLSTIPSVSLLYSTKKLQAPVSCDDEHDEHSKPSQSLNDRIALIREDITKLEVDAIVNAANQSLLGGGGVDGAIHAAAGHELYKECLTLNGCETGSAKITGAYKLPCKKVIHAVGPIYSRKKDRSAALLASCYTTSLQIAVENKCRSIAFSALSTGVYGYPSIEAAYVAITAVKEFLENKDGDKIDKVVFCTFVMKDVEAYDKWLPELLPPTEKDLGGEYQKADREKEALGDESERKPLDASEATEKIVEKKAKGKENAGENGTAETESEKVDEASDVKDSDDKPIRAEDLPNVPTGEPLAEGEPAPKKQKSEG